MLDVVTTNDPAEHRERLPSAPCTVLPNDLVSVLRIYFNEKLQLTDPINLNISQ